MLFEDKKYIHIELLEDGITIPEKRRAIVESKVGSKIVEVEKIVKAKDWKPTNAFRLRVTATVRKGKKRKVKKSTLVFEGKYMVKALEDAVKEHDKLIDEIKAEWQTTSLPTSKSGDKDRMYTFGEAFKKSLESRHLAAIAENEEFKTYKQVQGFYNNYLTPLEDIRLDQITEDTLNHIRAGMKHKDGTPMSKRTKLSVLQQVNPVYTWFNDNSNLTVKTPAKIKKGTLKKLGNKRSVRVDDISPLFNSMYTYKIERFRNIFIWLLHGRRVSEVLSLDWKHINMGKGTYTIKAENNKAGMDMTYLLTSYQLATLPTPKKSGIVFPAESGIQMQAVTLRTHWLKVRKEVGEWELNGHPASSSELRMHDIRHLLATEMLNKHEIVNEISGAALGHTAADITSTYAEIMHKSVHDAVEKTLDGVLK